MKIGDRVIINPEKVLVEEMENKPATIIENVIPDGQFAMLCGVNKWKIRFDEPIQLCGSQLSICKIREDELILMPN